MGRGGGSCELSASTTHLGMGIPVIQVGMSLDSSSERKKGNLAGMVILKISYTFQSPG